MRNQYNLRQYWIEVAIEDISSYDEDLAAKVTKYPVESLPLLEEAAKELGDEVTRPRPEGEEEPHDIQVMLKSDSRGTPLRDLKSEYISKLAKIPGIIIAASNIRAKPGLISILLTVS